MFLHADTIVPQDFDKSVRGCLQSEASVAIGAFSFELDIPPQVSLWGRLSLRLIMWGANRRSMPFATDAMALDLQLSTCCKVKFGRWTAYEPTQKCMR